MDLLEFVAMVNGDSLTLTAKLQSRFKEIGSMHIHLNPYFPNKLHKQELVAYNKAA